MRAPWVERLRMNSNEIVRSMDAGVAVSVSGVLIPSMSLAAEVVSTTSVIAVVVGG